MSTEQLTAQFGWWGLASLAVTVPWSLVHARRAAPALGWAITDELVAFKSGWVCVSMLCAWVKTSWRWRPKDP
jgi:hypothetical protein